MTPTKAVRERAVTLLGADTTTFNQPTDELVVRLFQNAAVPTETMAIGDFTQADFGGYAGLDVALGACPEGLNPQTDDSQIRLISADGDYVWETTNTSNLPQTIYGFYVTDAGGSILYAAERFAFPVELTMTNQTVIIPTPTLGVPNGVMR